MAYYALSNNDDSTEQSLSTSYKTIVQVSSQATGRGMVCDVLVGATDVPNATDCAIVYDVSRSTTTTTGTTIVPTSLNPADAAARSLGRINFTSEPTVTATTSLLTLSLNQRASQRWVAAPGMELVYPNTSANGLVLRALSTNFAAKVGCEFIFSDL